MKRVNQYGLLSVIFGTISLIFAFIATYAQSIYYVRANWFVFFYLDKYGFINHTPSTPYLSQSSLLTISESNAIFWCYLISIMFAVYSAASVFVAQLKREHTLLFSMGFVFVTSAVLLMHFKVGVLFGFVGFVIVMAIRHRQHITLTHHSSGTR